MKNKQGISLIVLIVTIIVIIILAAAVILTLNNNNPIDSSRIAQLTDSRANINSAISLFYGKVTASTQGDYDAKTIFTANYPKEGDIIKEDRLTDDEKKAIAGDQLGTSNYYQFNTSNLTDVTNVSLPAITNATWYLDITTGTAYLGYTSKANVPSWMYTDGAKTTMDSTLDQFVRVVEDGNLVTVANATK